MSNPYFQFKQFTIHQDRCAMKVTTDACLFGAWVAGEVKNQQPTFRTVLDLGTGTGLLSLMIAQKNPKLKILAIEIDERAAAQAKENVDSSSWKKQITVLKGDAKYFTFPVKFDLIITNPPFYENEIISAKATKNIAHHSQELKLEELLKIIKTFLQPQGEFFALLPYKRNEEIKKMFKDHQLQISRMLFVRQSIKHEYFRMMIKGKLRAENKEMEFDEISILDEKQRYTEAFIDLLRDYYLYL